MTEANLFRQYAKEAVHWASKVISENERRNLIDLAFNLGASSVDQREGVGAKLCFRRRATAVKPYP